ncbi:hypothetical protein HRG_011517 [Hirsutella rhossiliensis]|uniref:Cyanovirin-N domain-containing protein n=1 Tax=Hirsutella rhossiliensis TaxID=111463 RepID=A0A9P8MLK3_9HYPO|nr:uncharacterized protein HRG_11517 [Hirsutella rhossiliensis]KAH0957370.1 hypothetical protein HRG_11517 [Hirsutella rhossiliensis]
MKVTVSIALFLAALAQAAEMAPQDAQAAQVIQAPQGAGRMAEGDFKIPDNIKALGKDLARFGGCFLQRFWNDAKHINCGQCKKGGDYHESNLVSCICNNQDKVSHKIRRSFNVCVDQKAPFSKIIKEVGADVGGLGISALCGAYHGGQHHGSHGEHHHPAPRPEPFGPEYHG